MLGVPYLKHNCNTDLCIPGYFLPLVNIGKQEYSFLSKYSNLIPRLGRIGIVPIQNEILKQSFTDIW
jgi:hypothetical protein